MTSWMDDPEVVGELSEKFPDWKPHGVTGAPVKEYVAPVPGEDRDVTGREERYARSALESQCADLAAMGKDSGRNQFLNDSAFKMRRYISSGWLTQNEVIASLLDACRINGVLAEDGEAQCMKTIYSGLRGGGRVGAADVEWHAPDVPFTVTEGIEGYGTNGQALTADEVAEQVAMEREQRLRNDVLKAAYSFRVTDEGQRLYKSQRAAEQGQDRPPVERLTDMLMVPDEDATYRISRLLPTGGRALLAAQYKAGKTSLMANLIRSLADGHPFMGRFEVQPTSRLTLIDTELDTRMLRRWLREVGIVKTDSINVLSLRGKLSTFDILDNDVRAHWAAQISGSDFVILDCLRPCLDAIGLDENRDAGQFLVAFDELCKEGGASDAVMVHHMGHQGENSKDRARGDSRLLDWPDVLWKIVRNNDDDSDDSRYFSAMGRDVLVEESRLIWNAEDRSLFLQDGNRSEHGAAGAIPDIADLLSRPEHGDGLGQNAIERAMKGFGHGRNVVRAALRQATHAGAFVTSEGPRRSTLYLVNPSFEGSLDEN